jgi:hypothetical protein
LVAKKFDKTLKNDAIFAEQQGDALFKPLFTNELGSKNIKKKIWAVIPVQPLLGGRFLTEGRSLDASPKPRGNGSTSPDEWTKQNKASFQIAAIYPGPCPCLFSFARRHQALL